MIYTFKRWLFAGLLLIGIVVLGLQIYRTRINEQQEISQNVLRFHIRAASNQQEAQNLKLKVRDAFLDTLSTYRTQMTDIESARQIVLDHMSELIDCMKDVLEVQGIKEEISVKLGKSWFPQKAYGDIILPEGDYEAVIVNIGSGNGKNWWCVLFPQLCFIDARESYVPREGKASLREHLTEDTYASVLDERVEARLKIVEWLKEVF